MQSPTVTSSSLVNDYLEYARREQGRATMTLYQYGLDYTHLLEHLGSTHLLDATADQLREWVHRPNKYTGEGVGPSTVKGRTAKLRSLFNYMVDVRQLAHFNTAKQLHIPTVHNEEPKPAPEDEWRALWASDLRVSDRVAFGLGYFCGLRRHEVTLLAPFNFVEVPKPRIANFQRKGGKKMSLPFVSCALMYAQRRPDLIGGSAETFLGPLGELLAQRRAAGATYLLDWKELQRAPRNTKHPMPEELIAPNRYNNRLRDALAAADLPDLAFSPHQLRHSFGTNMLAMGMSLLEVSRLMGHSSVQVTQRYIATVEDPFQSHLDDGADMGVLVSGPWG